MSAKQLDHASCVPLLRAERSRKAYGILGQVMKLCGHVTCGKTCTDTLVKPAKQCIVCDVKLADKEIIELAGEGASSSIVFVPYLVLSD